MGGKQSKLKKELATLKADAAAATTKHQEELEGLRSEKRMLEFKLHALQEMTAKAQLEADTATQLALESEEKMKALKWELVRRLSVPANKTPVSPSNSNLTSSTSSSISSLKSESLAVDSATSAIPRVPVSWKLKEGVALRRSNTSFIPKTRPKAQSDPLSYTKEHATTITNNVTIETVSKRVDLIAPHAKSQLADSRTNSSGRISSNQDDAAESKQAPKATEAPVVASSPAMAAPASDFDKFAPVKRRSLNRDVIATPATLTAAASQAKDTERVENIDKASTRGDDKAVKDSDSDRERSFKSNSSSKSEDSDATPAAKGRGVLAATKRMAPQGSKATEDDVLALSDDEDD